ncbi:MAG: MarR family transcriptional regulator [Vicinamibacterales bacterium]
MATALQDELKQARPYADVEEEAHVAIARTAALLDRAIAQMLRPHGLTPTQYNVLRILRGAGPDGLCRHELGDRLVTPVPDVTRLLDRMEDLQLIARQRSATDRRLVGTFITPKGLELVGQLDLAVRNWHRQRLAHIPPDRLHALVDTLALMRQDG